MDKNFIPTREINQIIQRNILGGAKTPHSVSMPVLRKISDGYAIAVFVFFYKRENIESGMIPRPTVWATADLVTGEIIEEFSCPESDFSDASYEILYSVKADNKYDKSAQYLDKTFSLLDQVRRILIESGKINMQVYQQYLDRVLYNIPKDYQRFFLDLSKIEGGDITMENSNSFNNVAEESIKEENIAEEIIQQMEVEPKPAVALNEVTEKLGEIQKALAALQTCFDDKIMEDKHKNEMFDNMHEELTSYQNGLLDKVINTMVMDIIQLVDSTKKNYKLYEKKEPTEESYQKLLRCLKGVVEDLQDILYRQSIEPYSVPGKELDVRKQKIIQFVDTDDEAKNNLLAVRTADGYEKEGKVIRPERIKVYKYNPDANKSN